MIEPQSQKGEITMIHRFLQKILAAGCCMLLLAGCDTGAAENAPQAITSESEGDRLIDSADLIGSVTSVEADGFALQPTLLALVRMCSLAKMAVLRGRSLMLQAAL